MPQFTGVCKELPELEKCYLPGIALEVNCPSCQKLHYRDLSITPLIYGRPNLTLKCWSKRAWLVEGCGHIWDIHIDIEIKVRVK